MTRSCYLCRYKSRNKDLHRFPKDKKIRSAWMYACGLQEGTDDVNNIFICGYHFDLNAKMESTKGNTKRIILKKGAIPIKKVANNLPNELLIDYGYIPPLESPIDPLSDIKIESFTKTEDISYDFSNVNFPSVLSLPKQVTRKQFIQSNFMNGLSISDFSTTIKANNTLNLIKKSYNNKIKKIKYLKKKQRYCLQRTKFLKNLIINLRDDALISQEAESILSNYFDQLVSYQNGNNKKNNVLVP